MNVPPIVSRLLPVFIAWLLATSAVALAEAPKLNRIPDTRYDLDGIVHEYIDGITQNWLLTMPDRNPAILEMFADRDKTPPRDLLLWSGEFAGKYLTGATQTLRLTHDPKLKETIAQFVEKLLPLQADDGYLGPFPSDNRLEGKGGKWDAWGHYHIMLGLLLWHEETGDPRALSCSVKIADLLCRKFLKTGKRIVDTGSAEMNQSVLHSLCLLYKVTKTPAYLELARQIADEEFTAKGAGNYLNLALAGKEFYEGPKPRWESLHAIQGIAELYWLTGDARYRQGFEQIWWSIAKTDRHNNGGFSSGEKAQGNPYHKGAIETCCTVAWIALSVDMLRLTGNSIVADELELSTLNQVLGYQHRSGWWCTYDTPMDGARVNSTKQIGFQIRPGSEEINCCSANAPRGFGMISDWALMSDESGLVVNWYGPSSMTAKWKGTPITIRQTTEYPREGRINLTVSPEQPRKFALNLRIPHWSAATRVLVNGQEIAGAQPGTYLPLDREWRPGDTVQIDMDMSLHFWAGERECAGLASVYRGPLLLVYELPRRWPGPMSPQPQSSAWKWFGQMAASKEIGAAYEMPFEGTSVTWKGHKFDDAGQARVTIDDQEVATVDQYGPKRGEPFEWKTQDLKLGKHTLKITVLDTKHADSKEHWINVGGIEPVLYAGPSLRKGWNDRVVPAVGAEAPICTLEFTNDWATFRLRDYATAGEGGTYYLSWLDIKGIRPTPFSTTNPLRSSR